MLRNTVLAADDESPSSGRGDGLAAAWALRARRRRHVYEQFELGHDRGSSHGRTRIFRLAYPEAEWVRLAQEALAGWRALEAESGEDLLGLYGLVELAASRGRARARRSTRAASRIGCSTRDEARRVGVVAARGLDRALPAGRRRRAAPTARAARSSRRPASRRGRTARRVGRRARRRRRRRHRRLVGPRRSCPRLPVSVTRETVAYFGREGPPPPSVVELDARRAATAMYALHDPVHGLKAGATTRGTPADPDAEGGPDPAIVERIAAWVRARFPDVDPEPVDAETCLYTTHRRRALRPRAARPGRRRLRLLGPRLQVRARGRRAARGARPRARLIAVAMPFYQRLGDVPRKRHVQFRDNGTLLTEEVMGLEGFTGNESILYHLQSPCRVMELGGFEPIEREEWVPDAARAPALQDVRHRARGRRRDHRPSPADVERRRRDLALPARPARWTTSSATARATR